MIRRIRAIAATSPSELAEDLLHSLSNGGDDEPEVDTSLQILLKNAVRSSWGEPDASRVWKRLSRRVTGPFGALAMEGPALAAIVANYSDEQTPLATGCRHDEVYSELRSNSELASDRARAGCFRMSEGALTLK